MMVDVMDPMDDPLEDEEYIRELYDDDCDEEDEDDD